MRRNSVYAIEGSLLNNRYRVEETAGIGGTAVILRCTDIQTRNKKAVKTFFDDEEKLTVKLIQRIHSEPKLNIKSSYAIQSEEFFFDGYSNLVQPFIPGENIRTKMTTKNIIPKPQALYIALCLAQAANDLHKAGILSTDIKPENVIVTPEGVAKLLDLTCYEEIGKSPFLSKGTIPYACQQLLNREILTPHVDIYSIGVTLCEMLLGTEELEKMLIYQNINIKTKFIQHISPIEQKHPDIAPIIRKAINPNGYKSADELLNDLSSIYNSITGYKLSNEKKLVLLCNGKEISIRKGMFTIGRNNIDLTNPYISGTHFQVEYDGIFLARIKDIGSMNGTCVNGRKIRTRRWKKLYDTDEIQIANVSLKVKLP